MFFNQTLDESKSLYKLVTRDRFLKIARAFS